MKTQETFWSKLHDLWAIRRQITMTTRERVMLAIVVLLILGIIVNFLLKW